MQHPSMVVEIGYNQIQVSAPIAPFRLTGVIWLRCDCQ